MPQESYNKDAKPTALSSQAGRQSFNVTPKRAVVFVDGSNWYHKLRTLLNLNTPAGQNDMKPPVDFDLRSFITNLTVPDVLVELRYYIGKVRRVRNDQKSETMYANQQRLIGFLQQQNVHIGFGHLINYPDGSFHEKGVDILLAVDMLNLALEKKYDIAYLISSDTDLVPAVEECRKLGCDVVYVGSSLHGQSFGLTKVCSKTILLQPKDVFPYVPPKLL